ncbi:multiple sugar transport system substrate-binding protein [Microlunatus panaciterrae]|uniref:Multiple sugar transport system substrate-binding protein n=1 Tax=Microlunatus panaciterrae TaxID=400768 RepID=A0ABS2RGR8_9ACTN|nr:sugar ABC transporter substrate-binding protein [Microlunatus panaciterrae]MBM7797386.1 multiple sugar transport system substrate-binding protein [Microlunatus panaciterrae]
MSRRHFLGALGLGAAALGSGPLLAACGGGSSGVGNGGGGGDKSKPTINQWYHQYGEAGTQQAVMRYAKEYPDANVKVQWTPGDYTSKLNSGLLSSAGPDVFESGVNIDQVQSKQVVDIDDIMKDVKSDYTEADLKSTTVDGKIYGVKMVDDMGVLYYRKSVLDKAGVKPPTSMDELIAASKELTTSKQKGLFIGNDAGVTPSFGGGALLGQILWCVGQDFLTADNKPGFNTPEAKESFLKLRELFDSKSLLLGAPTDWWDPSSFTQGLAAMQWCGLWALPGIKKAIGDDFGVVAWPAFSSSVGKPSTFLGGWTAMVSAKAKDVEAAKAFVKWLWIDNSKDQEDFNLSYGFHIPPRKSLAAKAEKLKQGPAADALKIFNDYAVPSNPAWTPKMSSAYADAATAIVRKNGDVDSNLKKAEATVKTELNRLFG